MVCTINGYLYNRKGILFMIKKMPILLSYYSVLYTPTRTILFFKKLNN